jgi:hypothetical protein
MRETKVLKPLEMKCTYSFSKQYIMLKQKKIFQRFERNGRYIIFQFFGFLKINEKIYIEFEEKINKVTIFFKKNSYKHKNQCI